MQVMGFVVWLRVPNHVSPERIAKEIKTSVGFGQAQVTPICVFPDSPAVSQVYPVHTEPLAHDGYATHSHHAGPDHLGVHRKEWSDNV